MSTPRASLRERLVGQSEAERAVIGYLTLGDPADDFADCARAILDAGALTLELGLPLAAPSEGPVLLASHERARASGFDEETALDLLNAVHTSNPDVPLIAVNQWPALGSTEALRSFISRASSAGASAVLVIGLPFGQLSSFREACDDFAVESILSCFPDTPARMRSMIYRHCTGCIYIARSRGSSGGDGVENVEELCREMRAETNLPLIVGFGIHDSASVARVCGAGAHAAVVGSALVERAASGARAAARFTADLLEQ